MSHFADAISATNENRAVKGWRVLHACETLDRASGLVEAQTGVGMNPQVLSRDFWSTIPQEPLSLMNAWHDVRDWRHALNDAEALWSPQVLHAHSFAAAMAGVRGSLPAVYDFSETLDEVASQQSNSGSWLVRSFRVAEQFALGRASAVVAHSAGMKNMAHERGAAEANIFAVPEPCSAERLSLDALWTTEHGIDIGYDSVLYAAADAAGIECALRGFATITEELERAVLVFESDNPDRGEVVRLARQFGIADCIRCIPSSERALGMACASVVIVPPSGDAGGRANAAMLMAMAAGKAVVAADVPENRECSEDGRGCVWYRGEDAMDLAQRASFVARNEDFSRSLGESGRGHIELTRAPQVIARKYDEVYRHAVSRRTETTPKIPVPKMYALRTT